MADDLRRQLGTALAAVDEYYADLVARPSSEVSQHPAPFLRDYRIVRVEHFSPHKPVLFYAGFAPNKPAFLLTGNPDGYVQLAKNDNVVIDSPEWAVRYATTFLKVTRSMARLFYLVSSVDDLKFRPGLRAREAAAKAAFKAQYAAIIAPPAVQANDNGYLVVVYAVREQDLERHTLAVHRDGAIDDEIKRLEHDLPLVYGH